MNIKRFILFFVFISLYVPLYGLTVSVCSEAMYHVPEAKKLPEKEKAKFCSSYQNYVNQGYSKISAIIFAKKVVGIK